jgi:uncharacterized protein (DUF1697 family)
VVRAAAGGETVERVGDDALATGDEAVEAVDGNLFFWHPHGIGSSQMAGKAQPRLIGTGTGRNWSTVLKLAALVGL